MDTDDAGSALCPSAAAALCLIGVGAAAILGRMSPSAGAAAILPPSGGAGVGITPSPIRAILAQAGRPGLVNLAGGLPDPALFPRAELAGCAAAALRDGACLQYAGSAGLPELRDLVAARLRGRGVPCGAEEILITNGSQHGLAVAARLLAGPGRRIALEAPAYPGARQAAELSGAATADLPLADDGAPDGAALRRLHAEAPIAAVMGMATARNPTGRTLTAAARERCAALLGGLGIAMAEDEAYADLWFDAPPPPPAAALLPDAVLLGSFSKILAPGLRLGWLRVPPARAGDAQLLLQATCLHANGLAQATVLAWLRSGGLDAHLDAVRAACRARCRRMLAAIRALGLDCREPDGGMFCWLPLPAGASASAVAARALDAGIAVVPEAAFHAAGGPDRHLRLSFAAAPAAAMEDALARLAALVR